MDGSLTDGRIGRDVTALTIFTCADRRYEDFVPLFVASALWSNPEAHVEVGLEDAAGHVAGAAYGVLRELLDDRFTLRTVQWQDSRGRPILANTVRFLTTPQVEARYTYISDIDIVMLDHDIVPAHVAYMDATGLPYSNWARNGANRLTGLHFTRSDFQYPLPDLGDLPLHRLNDEELLFVLVERKLGRPPPKLAMFRPVHGIHVSPNRAPVTMRRGDRTVPGWGIPPHVTAWRSFCATTIFKAIAPTLSPRLVSCVQQIDAVADRLERRAAVAARRDAKR